MRRALLLAAVAVLLGLPRPSPADTTPPRIDCPQRWAECVGDPARGEGAAVEMLRARDREEQDPVRRRCGAEERACEDQAYYPWPQGPRPHAGC